MNPYLKKLGVDSPDPNHFELLHIRHDEVDGDVIKAAAKKALHRLGSDPDDDSHGDWKHVQRQIKQAYHCLIDDQQRTIYTATLVEQQSSADVADLEDFSLTVHDGDEQDTESGLDTVTDELRAEIQSAEQSRP
ncbi:MAG: hypothetical protein ACR2NP_21045, partial [Pirellulaceae bacterium]